ncbi:MAG: FeoA family protein [Cyclobacteriaceae bacterium]
MTAAQLKDREVRIIESISSSPYIVRLLEMGVLPGKSIQLFKKAPLRGPLALLVDDHFIALREEEAELINLKALS